ncbi:uncharacterized protein F5891DRAFT_1128178 [Suillus fuscotomentosus]|uniref:C2H2-type domain-containing protein n=1 Tax=Suillus fuscotomentosus TaxID=1912939 RepID=A0AAD4E7L3_9AGAM|nr:uncharacterized protein F5891DRAFT_1128178 [Suillus fuscotomentosus]KAG1901072.1 hypothetical protein F5891DRAFT_1128178 [Suillus fuscotomentosus]
MSIILPDAETMPDTIPRTQVHRRDFSVLQLPCGHAGCKQFFKIGAGRTKHILSAHPVISSPPPEQDMDIDVPDVLLQQLEDRYNGQDFPFSPDNKEHDLGYSHDHCADALRSSPLPDVDTEFFGPGNHLFHNYHAQLNGRPCDIHGCFLDDNALPPTHEPQSPNDWMPFHNRTEFETADFFYTQNPTPARKIDAHLALWASTLLKHGDAPLFADNQDLYAMIPMLLVTMIDAIPLGEVKWECEKPEGSYPPWMDSTFDVWYRDLHQVVRNMLANPNFTHKMDFRPYREYSTSGEERHYRDFMSADWAWDQADIISKDPDTIGATFIPVILGSDKTTVSVGTGNNEYYPLYLSIGNIHNNVRHAHRNAVVVIGFLAMPKTTKEHTSDPHFLKFCHQLFHASLSKILERLRPGMTKPEVAKFGDGHFRRVIYGLGPYIADYEEQVLLACIVRCWSGALPRCQAYTEELVSVGTYLELWDEFGVVADLVPFTNDFPRADICQLIAPNILHQLIKGTFKDHLVDWVHKYLLQTHGAHDAQHILDDIDHRIASVAPFAGLRRFPQGRGFKQWTGDDSKALMKVYIAAIEGHVPVEIIRTFRAFLEFCYIVQKNTITEGMLEKLQDAISCFHHYRKIFLETDTVSTFSLPRQHSVSHYLQLIRLFGAPNGLCSSITESKHIKAVKNPWRRSSKYNALGQMLVTNQQLDKLAAARVDFTSRGMLDGTCLSAALDALCKDHALTTTNDAICNAHDEDFDMSVPEDDINGVDPGPTVLQAHTRLVRTARNTNSQRHSLDIPRLPEMVCRFLFQQTRPDDPRDGKISFYAPSDISGIGGMRIEHIRACPMWRNEAPRYDCAFVNIGSEDVGIRGLEVARIHAFFSFIYGGKTYLCAVMRWFNIIGDLPDEDTGMWMVHPACGTNNAPLYNIIHVDSIYRVAHLIPIYGRHFLRHDINLHNSYDSFRTFYVNKYADHHAFELAS